MFVLNQHIAIGPQEQQKFVFERVNAVKVERSVDMLVDKATITLPTKFILKGQNETKKTEQAIKVGDEVEITLEYTDVLKQKAFTGYVSAIKPNTPVEIECEDAMYLLRKKSINKNMTETTLKEVLNEIVSNTNLQISEQTVDMVIGSFLMKNANALKCLEELKEQYGLSIYIDDQNKLYAGFRSVRNASNKTIYHLDRNVIESDLEWKNADDVRLKIKAIGVKADNSRIEVEVGDPDGEERTLFKYDEENADSLRQWATAEMVKYKYTGYTGTIKGFFAPLCDRGFAVVVKDDDYPEREGTYFASKVTIDWSTSGARRTVELTEKL